METTAMGYLGTTIRIHSFIPIEPAGQPRLDYLLAAENKRICSNTFECVPKLGIPFWGSLS